MNKTEINGLTIIDDPCGTELASSKEERMEWYKALLNGRKNLKLDYSDIGIPMLEEK